MRIVFLSASILSLFFPSAFAGENSFAKRRQEIREWVISHAQPSLRTFEPNPNDRPEALVDQMAYWNLAEMDSAKLLEAELKDSPWSDSYWPTFAGQIANRYADPQFNSSLAWRSNYDYLKGVMGKGSTELLSPAEKYDLLVGDLNFTLTNKMIRAGGNYASTSGEVPSWFGLCHGWAPASFMLPRPARSVKAQAVDGTEIEFTPSDIKALATLAWANGPGYTRFVGGRCNEKDRDWSGERREKNPDCRDTNPATWHISVVNQIAVSGRSFVMDASAGMEVWNQPIFGYSYHYVHPVTEKRARNLREAIIALKDFPADRYREHRSPKAVSIVNIEMDVNYLVETTPSKAKTDAPANDSHVVLTYSYDLELDGQKNIVGGEWHGDSHPDFLWVPVPGSTAQSLGDYWLDRAGDASEWRGNATIPVSWQKAAQLSSSREQPLIRVLNQLLQKAKP